MDIEDAYDERLIQLEPRLQEYIRRKNFNEENDIEPSIPVEQEFCITPYDLKVIKRYMQGKSNIYPSKILSKDPHFIKIKKDSKPFQDNEFSNDPRYARLQKKMQSHKDARKHITNFEGLDDDYLIFHQSNPYDLKPQNKPQKMAKPYDDPSNLNDDYDDNIYDDNIMLDSRDLMLNSNKHKKKSYQNQSYCYNTNNKSKNESAYHHPPRIAYNQVIIPQKVNGGLKHSRDVSDVIGNLDVYNKHLNETYEYINDDNQYSPDEYINNNNKYNHVNNSHKHNTDRIIDNDVNYKQKSRKTQREMQSGYQNIPFRYGNGLPDVSLEDSLRGGFRDTSKKSTGFRNSFENNFQYVSEDMSDPNHNVQMWPQNTRGANKQIARAKSEAVMKEKMLRDRSVYFN
jgi:hypothetical protein